MHEPRTRGFTISPLTQDYGCLLPKVKPQQIVVNRLTIAYANHRPETVRLSEGFMRAHQAVVLEEPPDDNLPVMLDGRLSIDDYLLGQEIEYPAFSSEQCRLLRELHRRGISIIQAEPYYEHLFWVQNFFADGHGPDELDQSTEQYLVYSREKEATGKLIAYYEAVRTGDFEHIVASVRAFAAADAGRFRLRDRLRARSIAAHCSKHRHICVEAGPMHLLLYRYLYESLPGHWSVRPVFVENSALKEIGCRSGLYGPGDSLTAHYLLGNALLEEHENLLAARSLIFMKINAKHELDNWETDFPHLRNESAVNQMVRKLSYRRCRRLFSETAAASAEEAFQLVRRAASRS